MDRLHSMRVFARVIDEGSFAAAARALNVSPAAVTRLVADLEEHLGARLVNRTTRRLALTDIGESYLERVRHILADVEDAEALATASTVEARGHLRVLCAPAFAPLPIGSSTWQPARSRSAAWRGMHQDGRHVRLPPYAPAVDQDQRRAQGQAAQSHCRPAIRRLEAGLRHRERDLGGAGEHGDDTARAALLDLLAKRWPAGLHVKVHVPVASRTSLAVHAFVRPLTRSRPCT